MSRQYPYMHIFAVSGMSMATEGLSVYKVTNGKVVYEEFFRNMWVHEPG
jgi:hypothetical protein